MLKAYYSGVFVYVCYRTCIAVGSHFSLSLAYCAMAAKSLPSFFLLPIPPNRLSDV
jgi:hypothetical protein